MEIKSWDNQIREEENRWIKLKLGNLCIDERKRKGYTQKQLSEKLEISDKTISKRERGRGMPDVSLLQPLCDALGISLNELFSGEHISAEEYKGKAEENISKLYKEKQIANLKPIKYLFSTCSNVWVNDVNIIWNEKEAGQWEMRPNALLLCLFGTNCNIFLIATFRFIGNSHF